MPRLDPVPRPTDHAGIAQDLADIVIVDAAVLDALGDHAREVVERSQAPLLVMR